MGSRSPTARRPRSVATTSISLCAGAISPKHCPSTAEPPVRLFRARMNDTLLQALALIPALVIAIVFHEVAHGWTALMLGDPTAKERKRLSLNPIRHVDPFGTLILPGLLLLSGLPAFGWAKPVPVIKQRLNNPRFGMMAVAAAGPATNIVLAAIGAIAMGLVVRANPHAGAAATFIGATLSSFVGINIFL